MVKFNKMHTVRQIMGNGPTYFFALLLFLLLVVFLLLFLSAQVLSRRVLSHHCTDYSEILRYSRYGCDVV